MKPKQAAVWGAGGHGRVVADLVLALQIDLVGFVDADEERLGATVLPFEQRMILSEREVLSGDVRLLGEAVVVPGVGSNGARLRGVDQLATRCAPALVHPTATVSRFAMLGRGTVVLAGAVINAGATIGRGVIINSGAVVEHDCVVGDGAHVSPGAVLTGGVHLGRLSWVGANATVLPALRIGNGVTIGAGAVVLGDLGDSVTVAGNPARIIHRRTS